MGERRKIKICDYDGRKLDTAIILTDKDVKKAFQKWKKKGLL